MNNKGKIISAIIFRVVGLILIIFGFVVYLTPNKNDIDTNDIEVKVVIILVLFLFGAVLLSIGVGLFPGAESMPKFPRWIGH